MPDKYQNIRDYHEIELAKKITAMNRKHKIRERILIILMIICVLGLIYVEFFSTFENK